MKITTSQLAAPRWFCPVRFGEFTARPENQKFLNADGTVNADHVEELLAAYREFVGRKQLETDSIMIRQTLNDRR